MSQDIWDQIRRLADRDGFKPDQAPEIYGPTDVNAQSSNGQLAVGINDEGTLTVFRWPRPSFYDQIKYHTQTRAAPRFGVAPNEGAFLGVRTGSETTWFRDWETNQRYADGFTDAVVTEHRSPEHGLTATVVDVVPPERDVLARTVTVDRAADGHEQIDLVAFENLNLVVTKEPENPVQDWAREVENDDNARYESDVGAVVHATSGTDESTGESRSVAVAVGFDGTVDRHQVGGDASEQTADPESRDAYEAATDGVFPGNDRYEGQTTAAITTTLDVSSASATATLLFASAETPPEALSLLDEARDRSQKDRRDAKRSWIESALDDPPMPDANEAVRAVARRALVTLVTNYDPESGAIVASIATQAPYGLDWVRDGAYFNHALDLLGLEEWVETRNRWYVSLQQQVPEYRMDELGTPPGNWAMNYYADGVPGGPIPWEIDETAYGVWSLYDHYRITGDEEYLRDVYPAIRRAADFLTMYTDPQTGLHYPAHEDDNVVPSQTIVGAGAVKLGLDAAIDAAAALDKEGDTTRYRDRRDELETAIDDHLWDPDDGAYSEGTPDLERADGFPLVPDADAEPTVGWPVELKPPDAPRMERHLERVWDAISPTFAEPEAAERDSGQYEVKGLISLARAWQGDPERMDDVRDGVRWVAREHATDDTHVMGELWLRDDDEIVTSMSQPHTWEQLLFYYASLEAFPPDGIDPATDSWQGVLEQLRRNMSTGP